MTELEEFEAFFKKMGVPYEKNFGLDKLKDDKDILSVTQCHFHFQKGVFTGAEADEMGYFDDRVSNP